MNYPTAQSHPYLIGNSSKEDLAKWIQWMVDSQFLTLLEGETPREAVADCSRSVVCSYLTDPHSMARRQMPMAMDFLRLDSKEQEEVVAKGFESKNLS